MEGWTYIKVILPLKLAWEPYYKTSEPEVLPGMRVTVCFAGRNYVGVVSETCVKPDVPVDRILEVRKLERHLDPVSGNEIKLWRFISEYYLCTIGEVYRAAYPSVKTAGEQVSARAEERHEALKKKTLELYGRKLDRLAARLRVKEEALKGKHGQKVMLELEAARSRILEEIERAKEAMAAIASGVEDSVSASQRPQNISVVANCQASEDMKMAFSEGKQVLLEGGNSRISTILPIATDMLAEGRDVLMLVPEISLTKQLQADLSDIFGESLRMFHSGESASSRRDTAAALRQGGRPLFILGTYSALFLPFRNLGLIVVEDEHDTAYKHDGTPRFMTRDTAVMLGEIHGAKVILSSPTPSLESLFNCMSGRYVHVCTVKDGGDTIIVDTSAEKKKRGMVGNLSRILIKSIKDTMDRGGRTLILRPWGPMDDLTAEVGALFPGLPGIEILSISEVRRKEIGGYALVAVTGTDILLDKQDFRADERTIQTLGQLRSRFSGTMLIQTKQSQHPVFTEGDGYVSRLLSERKAFHYPPYSRMVDVIVNDSNTSRLKKLSRCLADGLKEFSPTGPFTPIKGRTPVEATAVIRMMLPKDRNLAARKKKIAAIAGDFEKSYGYSGHITIDVDPV